ncbi:lymphocyte-specific helicase-like [Athalia rosae]|uniref:lymphocyte-specific helicase-like n=1 Tax=Athalia rosae TaxID=37344 RepID=UPI0020334E9D|nr:lymphocyte-specific helicase-like [Athalia rosae]
MSNQTIESSSNTSKEARNVEFIGICDDSGFASISGSVATDSVPLDEDSHSSIADNVTFNQTPLETTIHENTSLPKVLGKKQLRLQAEKEKKLAATEKYNQDIRDSRYKRLMHLLDRSQFYANYLVQKIDASSQKQTLKPNLKRKTKVKDENAPPKKKTKKPQDWQDYNISEYMTKENMNVKADQKNLNSSQEEIIGDTDAVKYELKDHGDVKLKYFNGKLRDYQIQGLRWLQVLYENGVNGILADEMGLGKTIQVIALICHLVEKKIPGPYLIIAPLSTIPNWLTEFENFAPKIPVVLLHGNPEKRNQATKKITKFAKIDEHQTQPVVLTTFEVPLQQEYFLRMQQWRYIIIDEGHRIKNYKCQLLQVLKKCQSMNRLLLTGTPLQNDLSELWSLLNFLLPEIFNELAVFESWFDANELQDEEGTARILKQESEKQVLSSLREILKPFMLRRLKSDVCLDIPAKKEVVVYAPMTELQHALYKAVLDRDIHVLSKIEEESLILPEIDGQRPKRRCTLKANQVESATRATRANRERHYSRESTPSGDETATMKWERNTSPNESKLTEWKQYTNIDDRNRDFFIRVQTNQRGVMYKKIVNHPYLIHCPLGFDGLPKIDEELVKSSGKLLVLDAMLQKLKAGGHRVLLFSTWTMILDVLEDYLNMRKFSYVRLDGTFKFEERQRDLKLFNSDPNIFVFLITTRAGGVGLNLMAADTVIIYDSDWNPQADIQAMARCHRIGQTRPVVVYKLCTRGTIDERILNRAEAKRKLEKMVISKDLSRLNLMNVENLVHLKNLLQSSENSIVTAEKDVFTKKELDDLMDRSDLLPKMKQENTEKAEENI